MEYGDTISVEPDHRSLGEGGQPATASEPMSGVATLLRRLDNVSDRLSPIVVKEVRQIVRGREFNYSFMVSLVVGLLVAFFGAANASTGSGTTGQSVFTALTACLALLGIGIVPFGAFSALRNERLEQTMDLITVTSLSARKVIVGKLLAQAVKLATLFAGMAPFVATSFLLGGIDFVTIVVSLAMVFLVSLWVCGAALMVSSLAKTRGVSGALLAGGALVLLLFFGGFGIINRIMFALARGGSVFSGMSFTVSSPSGGWWALAIVVTLGALSLVNLVLLAENRLSSPVENKSTALRIGFFVQFLAIIGAFTAVAHLSSIPRAVDPLAVFGLLHLTLVAVFTVTEDFPVSRRVLRHIQTPSRWSPLWTILWPGGGRGAAYVLLQMVMLIVAVRLLSERDVGWVVAACGYLCFFTGAPVVLLRLVRPRISVFYIRVAILVLLSASLVLPDVLYYLVAQPNAFNLEYSNRHLLNPLRTVANWRTVEMRGLYLVPAIVGVLGVLTYARLMAMNRLYVAHSADRMMAPPEGSPKGGHYVIDWAAVHAAASWRLVVPRTPMRGRVGERLGAGTGSSLEFQDHRPYVPGDDLRHVDWKAFARSDVLSVRLYREVIAPRIDLVIDRSRSMTASASKHQAYGELVALLASAATSMSADTRLVTGAAAPPIPLHRPDDVERFLDCTASIGAVEEHGLLLRRQSMRVAVSDFLFPHDPDSVVGRLARDGASLAIIQLTTRDEAEPEVEGGRRLVDVEGHGALDVTIDARTVSEYRARFNRLRQELSRAARRAGATFVHVVAGATPRQVARVLADAGILEPR